MDRGEVNGGNYRFIKSFCYWWFALFFAASLLGCGGLVSSGSPQSPPPNLSVSVSPLSATVALGAMQTFVATVNNSANIAVTWDVNGISGGSSAIGTIDTNGVYTAPGILPASNSVSLRAISVSDPSKNATVQIPIASSFSLTVSGPPSLNASATASYTAALVPSSGSNPNRTVSWSVTGSGCSGASCGAITSTGNYTAPEFLPEPPIVLIIATPAADPAKFNSLPVTLASGVSISISPETSALPLGGSQTFHATVTGASDTSVTWDAGGAVGGNASLGTVNNSQSNPNEALYTAPLNLPAGNSVVIRARSNANANISASVLVTIFSGPMISTLIPSSATSGSVSGMVLSVAGGNFVSSNSGPSSAILVGRAARDTFCISRFQCTVQLTSSELVFSGNISISLRNPDGEVSNSVIFAVLPPVPDAIPLNAAAPSQTGKDIVVTGLSSNPGSPQAGNSALDVAAIGAYSVGTSSCSLGANPVVIARPSIGFATSNVCVFSPSGLDTSFRYTVSGPVAPDMIVVSSQDIGFGIVRLTLQVPATAATGPRTLFIENPSGDQAAGTGAIEVY